MTKVAEVFLFLSELASEKINYCTFFFDAASLAFTTTASSDFFVIGN